MIRRRGNFRTAALAALAAGCSSGGGSGVPIVFLHDSGRTVETGGRARADLGAGAEGGRAEAARVDS